MKVDGNVMRGESEGYSEWVRNRPQRRRRRHIAWLRWRATGCCGYPEERITVEVVDKDKDGNVLRRWSVTNCRLMGCRCRLAEAEAIAKKWEVLNQ